MINRMASLARIQPAPLVMCERVYLGGKLQSNLCTLAPGHDDEDSKRRV